MQVTESKSHSVFKAYVSLTVVNDKYASYWVLIILSVKCIFVIDYSQWQICRLLSLNHTQFSKHMCHWLWSMTNMQATESKSYSVFNAYLSLTVVNDKYASHWVSIKLSYQCIFVIDCGQWQICRPLSLNQTQCSMHICHWLRSMTDMQATESKSHSVFNAYLSLTVVNDKYASYWV